MPLFPAAKLGCLVIGVDMHTLIPAPPLPGIPIHPYLGSVFLWFTPNFPMSNVMINGIPACVSGAMGISAHIPQGAPVPPTPTNVSYWTRYLTNVAMALTLAGLTIFANIAIAMIAAGISAIGGISSSNPARKFIKDLTNIDTTNTMTTLTTINATFAAYTKWQTWAKLLMPPIPYPGAQGSVAVGSPNVTLNGGALAFGCGFVATSCSDIPVVPNANVIDFGTVYVGMSLGDLARAIAISTIQNAMQYGMQRGLQRMPNPLVDRYRTPTQHG